MNEKELYDLLLTLKLPVAYDHFEDDPINEVNPPFIAYKNSDPTTVKAEDQTWMRLNNYQVTLVTEKKDTGLESDLEELFAQNSIPFDKEEDYISDERIFEIRYFIS